MEQEYSQYHELIRGERRVSLSYIGEGYSGDYDPDDPEDAQLLRLDIAELIDGEWVTMDDGSYCTGIKLQTDAEVIADLLKGIMDEVALLERVKKAGERLSWLST